MTSDIPRKTKISKSGKCPNPRCGGMLEFDYGNSYGTFWTCNVCLKQAVLPTKSQLREFPERYWIVA